MQLCCLWENNFCAFYKRTNTLGKTSRFEIQKTSGHDGLSMNIWNAFLIEPVLLKIFEECNKRGTFLDRFKIAKITPLYRKGDKKISKPTGQAVFRVLSAKIPRNFFMDESWSSVKQSSPPMQFGFEDRMSCTDAIAAITNFMRNMIDKELTGQACFVDLSIP